MMRAVKELLYKAFSLSKYNEAAAFFVDAQDEAVRRQVNSRFGNLQLNNFFPLPNF